MHAATTAAADGDSDVNADDSNVFGLLFDAWYGEDKGDGFGLLGEDHFEGILEQQAQQQQQDERCSKRAARGCDNALDDEYNFDAGLDVHSSEYQRNKQQRLQ